MYLAKYFTVRKADSRNTREISPLRTKTKQKQDTEQEGIDAKRIHDNSPTDNYFSPTVNSPTRQRTDRTDHRQNFRKPTDTHTDTRQHVFVPGGLEKKYM